MSQDSASTMVITGYLHAVQVLQSRPPSVLISIGDPDSPSLPEAGIKSVLRMEFDDVEDEVLSRHYSGFTMWQARSLVRFAQDTASNPGDVLIHCGVGASRSTASALVLSYVRTGDVDAACEAIKAACQESVRLGYRSARTEITPNRLVLDLCGRVLGIGDDLVEASQRAFGCRRR